MPITWKGSPNYTKGRYLQRVNKIVIHWFGMGNLEAANRRFQNPNARVSAHYGISNNTVWQWVSEKDTAWHCGKWTMNLRSIGIENEATTTKPATETTYKCCARLVRDICTRYNLPIDRSTIIGHRDVVPTQCPGTFDINRVIKLAKEESMKKWTELIKFDGKDCWGKLAAEDVDWDKAKIIQMTGAPPIQAKGKPTQYTPLPSWDARLINHGTKKAKMVDVIGSCPTEKEIKEGIIQKIVDFLRKLFV